MKIQIKMTQKSNAEYYGVEIGSIVTEEFEKYVAAVVASEIGNVSYEACCAQAIACRTYAWRYILKSKPVSDSSASAQAFRINRYSGKYQNAIDAVNDTAGQILTYDGNPADTYFSQSNGGYTVSSEEQWGGSRPYLMSKPDTWDKAIGAHRLGHGVGMSQNGAKYAASTGVNHEDILAFYYPGTEITQIDYEGDDDVASKKITLKAFIDGVLSNASRIRYYKLGRSGNGGYSDCVGLVIGALSLAGTSWNGTHGSNYGARYRTKNLRKITSASQLKQGELIYKARNPGDAKYDSAVINSKYKNSGDLKDYYHVGVVLTVNPLKIAHCSSGGMHYDTKLGKWGYAGECTLVDYTAASTTTESTAVNASEGDNDMEGKCIVDVPNDTNVNVRASRSTNSKKLGMINEGSEVTVESDDGTWCKVKFEGYVMSKFLKQKN